MAHTVALVLGHAELRRRIELFTQVITFKLRLTGSSDPGLENQDHKHLTRRPTSKVSVQPQSFPFEASTLAAV